ncbi:MAG: hypothetical protein DDG60_02245 [Anaerolineae bacterium]|nr:MAG: hypothetical protein DDG60_02245 [Anaerolineae bacterium]
MKHLLLLVWMALQVGIAPIPASVRAPEPGESIQLSVQPLRQSKITSCGPAVLAMAYQYAYPSAGISEHEILAYAERQGWYTETKYPYTSPANMLNIVRHYTENFLSGQVHSSQQGLELLARELRRGNPIIIDALVRLEDRASGAHFVLVTGLSVAPDNRFAVTLTYLDPLIGEEKRAPYYGEAGLWNAWYRNGDPGGAGWWMVIPVPLPLDMPLRLGEYLAI